MRRFTYKERCEILQRARDTLARLAVDEAVEGLRQERLELQREVAHDRAFQQLQLKRKRWLARNQPLVYKVKMDARIR